MDVFKNEWLIVRRGVRLTPIIEPVILALDAYFKEANLKATVTSGERTSGDQLRIVKNYSKKFVKDEFPEVYDCDVMDKFMIGEVQVFKWQRAWSRLLNKGIIVNPPLPARCLFDYIRNGVNKKGQEIGASPHFYGRAFDIGGGLDHDPTNELEVIKKAMGKVKGLKGYLLERKNNCLHIDCV